MALTMPSIPSSNENQLVPSQRTMERAQIPPAKLNWPPRYTLAPDTAIALMGPLIPGKRKRGSQFSSPVAAEMELTDPKKIPTNGIKRGNLEMMTRNIGLNITMPLLLQRA